MQDYFVENKLFEFLTSKGVGASDASILAAAVRPWPNVFDVIANNAASQNERNEIFNHAIRMRWGRKA